MKKYYCCFGQRRSKRFINSEDRKFLYDSLNELLANDPLIFEALQASILIN